MADNTRTKQDAISLFRSMESDGDGELEPAELNAGLQGQQVYLPRETVLLLHHTIMHATKFDARTPEVRFAEYVVNARPPTFSSAVKMACARGLHKQAGILSVIFFWAARFSSLKRLPGWALLNPKK
jgi:hypothetical protein